MKKCIAVMLVVCLMICLSRCTYAEGDNRAESIENIILGVLEGEEAARLSIGGLSFDVDMDMIGLAVFAVVFLFPFYWPVLLFI